LPPAAAEAANVIQSEKCCAIVPFLWQINLLSVFTPAFYIINPCCF